MTAAALAPSIEYLENGVTLAFAVPFRFLSASHLSVSRVLASGAVAVLAQGTDWSATGGSTDAGGTLTLVATVAGSRLRIRRATPRTQEADWETGDRFPAQSIEDAHDKGALIDQELDVARDDLAARALLVPDGETAGVLPPREAGKFLGTDGAGDFAYLSGTGADAALRTDLANPALGAGLVAGVSGGTVKEAIFNKVDLPAVLGSQMGIGYRMSYNGADARYLGGMWPATNYAAWLFEAKFTAANTPGVGESPASALFAYAENDGSVKDVVAGMFVTYLKGAGGAGFATNHIVTGDIGLLNGKYVVSELDSQPAALATVNVNSITMPINAFNHAHPVCLQVGGVGGGSYANVLVAYTGTSAVLAGGAGATLGSLFSTGAATYTDSAGIFGNGHELRFNGTAASHFLMRCDGSNNFRLKFGAGAFVWRDPSDTSSVAVVGSDGSAAFGVNASVAGGYKIDVAPEVAGEAIGLLRGRTSAGDVSAELLTASGTAGNAAACALRLRANNVNSRSVNAGGTINASGADYAEYETRGPGCRQFAKGDVVGFDADGLLTDRFAEAVRFGVKSTNPNLVGGDIWADSVGPAPERPEFMAPTYAGVSDPGPSWPKADFADDYAALRDSLVQQVQVLRETPEGPTQEAIQAEIDRLSAQITVRRAEKDAADEALHEEWLAQHEQFAVDCASYEVAVSAAKGVWTNTVLAEWQAAIAAREAVIEELRAEVERVAYCGKVPVNITGALPGQYLLPCDDGNGGITARAINAGDMSAIEALARLGLVQRVLPDGRPEIVVHVG